MRFDYQAHTWGECHTVCGAPHTVVHMPYLDA